MKGKASCTAPAQHSWREGAGRRGPWPRSSSLSMGSSFTLGTVSHYLHRSPHLPMTLNEG